MYIYIYMYICIYIYIYVYVIMKILSPPGYPSPQWLCHNTSCTWAHDAQLHISGTNETKSAQQVKQGVSCKYS